ncbi:hypothetical protein [Streptomyces antibioticus]|uniref:hypothetical protein n=1 Tax=Streptomyces antibioticus TaxID=1890 RepID=UPI0036D8204C
MERLKERPAPELYKLAADLVKDPDASAEEREAVAVVEARARRVQERERAALEREGAERRAAEERERAERHEALERGRAEIRERNVHQARVEKVEKFALAVRGALKKAAREGRTITWTQLKHKTGLYQLSRLDHQEKVELLVLVESDTTPETPLWSTLLTAAASDGAGLRLHRDVSSRLSRPLPVSDAELVNQLTTECTRLHSQW